MSIFSRIKHGLGFEAVTEKVPARVEPEVISAPTIGDQAGRNGKKRQFLAAKIDRLNSQFVTQATPIDYALYSQGLVLLARARYLAKNNEYVKRYMAVVRNNVLGNTGIQLQGQIQAANQPFKRANDALEEAWLRWGKKKSEPELTGKHSWKKIQRFVVDGLTRDGEVFLLKNVGSSVNDFGFGLQLIDPVHVPFEKNEVLPNGNTVVMGVELNKFRRPVAYYLREKSNDLPGVHSVTGFKYRRIPASRVIHIMNEEFIDQTRGFTPMSAAISRLNMVARYDEATLVAARVGASQMLFYIDGDNDEPYVGDQEDESEGPYEYVEDVEPGIGRRLPQGADVKQFKPEQPATGYGEFNKWALRAAASALNISYHTLAQDMESVNFSSARTMTIEDREQWKSVQDQLVDDLHEPVFDAWLPMALLTGQIKVKGQSVSASRVDEFSRVNWQGRRWPWVDPLKDMQAAHLAASANIRSISSIIRDEGGDPDEVFREIQKEREVMKELGIEPVFLTKTEDSNGRERPETE